MTKIKTIVVTAAVTAAICIPVGAFAADPNLRGHLHLQRARHALKEAWTEISASQQANERVWGDEGGHGKQAKEAIEKANREIELAAEWVNSHPR
jgi:hypothetical protein